ncbi:DHH family phosphoesterase [Botrimarina hoheduenensis]|uniref:NanoRNase/pAp phosphatase n=1 Tax=Botrimarina hoheduenensis TaxID=2528000 RepID=A0A5C5VXL5_9BACT|nr:bifunctional oligoribonuclease/PAP phosphatase NrnA [Botrimarina hoheduenensis]TWT43366.1 NanoRNase/pAp phosphatase [Botrimarina hoheduenensis]
MTIDWKPLQQIVAQHDSFILTSHTRADCDAIGSELGLLLALEVLGKKGRIVNADAPPEHIRFLDPEGRIEVLGEGVTAADCHAADVHLIADTSAWGQLGDMAAVLRESPARRVVIDHHVSGDDLGALLLKDTHAEATGRLVLQACDALGVEVTPAIATPLFAAIATDTGWFRFPSVSSATYTAIARLVDAGAKPSAIFSSLYDQNTAQRVRLGGRIMNSLRLDLAGRLAIGVATLKDFAETGAVLSDTEDVVNRLLSVEGVEAAILIAAMDEEKTKVSLRSRTEVDVRLVAERFGGGGHTKAAGVRFAGTVEAAEAAIVAVLAEQLSAKTA